MLSISVPWRDLVKDYGRWHTLYMRFKRCSENGLLWSIFFELNQNKAIKMDIVFMDSTTLKVHRHGWGAKKIKDRKVLAKMWLAMARKCILFWQKIPPFRVQLTGANGHDCEPVQAMIEPLQDLGIKRFVGDKGYDDHKIREALLDLHIKADIPPRKNRLGHRFFDQTVYRWRWRVESFFGKLKENSRLALHVDKLDTSFLAFMPLALIKMMVCE